MNYETRRLPIITFTLMGINILVYLATLPFLLGSGGEDAQAWVYGHLWLIPAISSWHTYLTSMFVHGGFFHLLGNMVYLFLFGSCVEDMIGRWRFLVFYLLGGLVAQWVFVAAIPEHFASMIPMGGASGAISACLGGYLVLRASVEIDFKYFGLIFFRPFAGEFSLAAWIVITFWFLKDLFFAVLSFYLGQGQGGVAFGAHVGGFLAGLGLVALNKVISKKETKTPAGPIRVHVPVRPQVAARPMTDAALPKDQPESPPRTIYLFDGSNQLGPFNVFQVQEMLSLGSVTAETLYWSDGMTEWRGVTELA